MSNFESNSFSSKFSSNKLWFILLIAGVFFLALRNTTVLLNSYVYAEDGVWTGLGLTHGWVYTLLHARSDYFVVYNVVMLFISTKLSLLFTGNPLIFLPQSIALVSFIFYSSISVLIYFIVKKVSNGFYAIICYFLTLFIPLGDSQIEIIGRALQIGFYMPVLALTLFLLKEKVLSRFFSGLIACLIFLSAATNPVVVPIVFSVMFIDFLYADNKRACIKKHLPLFISLMVLLIILIPRLNGQGGIQNEPVHANILEMITARELLYPFIFPWYGKINNVISIVLFLFYFLYCAFCFFISKNKDSQKLIIYFFLAIVLYMMATTVGRLGLTYFLKNYQSTWPDRYYMGINILSICLFVICTSQLESYKSLRLVGRGITIVLIIVYCFNYNSIVESKSSEININAMITFQQQICTSVPVSDGLQQIFIYPKPRWNMVVPKDYIKHINCKKINY